MNCKSVMITLTDCAAMFDWRGFRGTEPPLDAASLTPYYEILRDLHLVSIQSPEIYINLSRSVAETIGACYIQKRWLLKWLAYFLLSFRDAAEFKICAEKVIALQCQLRESRAAEFAK